MTRILFVDDEPHILKVVERLIRIKRPGWHAGFVASGPAALAALEAERFDVIVTDLSMPSMDGVTLLGRVRERHPHMLRLALSGETALDESPRAGEVTHQWLAKPINLDVLIASVERLTWARALVDDAALVALATGIASLPSAPTVYAEVSRALARGAGLAEIAALVERDPAVVAKLLQLCNSAFYRTAQRVTSVATAAAVIGTDVLRGLLLSVELFHTHPGAEHLAAHSLLVAAVARAVAPAPVGADAFVVGVLHELGAYVLAQVRAPLAATPQLHARVGGVLCAIWGMPADVVRAVAYHHDPDAAPAPDEPLVRAVALAEHLVEELEAEARRAPPPPPLPWVDEAALAEHRAAARRAWDQHER